MQGRPPAIPTAPDEGLREPLAAGSDSMPDSDFLPDREPASPAIPTSPVQPVSQQASPPPGEVDVPDKPLKLEQVYGQVQHMEPERAAQVIQLAKAIGEPEQFVDRHLEDVKRAADAPPTSFFAQLEREHPETTRFLSDPRNMAMAHDDIQNLAAHESLVQHAKVAHGFFDSFKAGLESSLAGLIARNKLPDLQLPPQADQSWPEYLGAQAGGLAGDLPGMALVGAGTLPALGAAGSTVASFALPAAVKQAVLAHIQNGDSKSATELLGRLYDNYKEAFKQALVGVGTVAGGALGGKLAGGVGKFAGEAIAMPTVASAEEGKLPTVKDIAGGAMVMGGLHGLGAGGEAFFGRVTADKASESGEFYDRAGDLAANSKLRERAPEAYRQQLDALTKDSSVSDAYIPVKQFEEYFQSKRLDPEVVAQELGVTDSLTEARTQGEDGNVQVPFGRFAQTFGGTEHWQGLKEHVKFDPQDLTPRQDAEVRKAVAEFTQKAESEVAQKPDESTAPPVQSSEPSAIQTEISRQLEAAGLSAGEVKYNPQLVDAFYSTLGKRMGVDPQELFQRFPIRVERTDVTVSPGEGLQQADLRNEPHAITWEAIPSAGLGHEITSASPAARQEFTQQAMGILAGETGPDELAQRLGLEHSDTVAGSGGYQGAINSNAISSFRDADPAKVEAYARALQYVFKQDAVPYFRAEFGENRKLARAGLFTFSAPLDSAKEETFFKALREALGPDAGYTRINENEIAVINYRGENGKPALSDKKFVEALKKLGETHGETLGIQGTTGFRADANYGPVHDWGKDPDGRSLQLQGSAGGSPDLQDWLSGRRQVFEGLLRDWSGDALKQREQDLAGRTFEQSGIDSGRGAAGGGAREETAPGAVRANAEETRPLVGLPASSPGPIPSIRQAAEGYAKEANLPLRQQAEYVKADPERGARIAKAYEAMKHEPNDPEVKAAYRALIDETLAQYQAIKKTGLQVDVIESGMPNPYPEGPRQVLEDLRKGHLWLFPTDSGFGTGADSSGHPLLEPTEERIGDRQLLANDVFRIVHDVFGHGKEGNGFGPHGEENAWQSHVRMYSDLAARAMTTETRGQNSWVNFGPHGEQNRSNQKETVYADQKAGLLPEWVMKDGLAPDAGRTYQQDNGPRGRIRIGNTELSIDLLKTADRSTFFHEMGHAFLEVMGHAASDPNAPEQLRQDYATVLKFLGADSREAIQTEHHEKWAKAFETYLSEGKAPSEALRPAFDRFKDWLVSIYGDIKRALGVELSPEIRDVMDRMLATQEEIERARQTIGQREELVKGLPPEVARRLADLEARAKSQAESALLKEQMAELTSKNREFLDKERARIEKEVTSQVKDQPVYRAMDMVAKASRKNAAEQAHLFLEDRVTDKVAGAFEAAAEVHGFAGGEELAKAIVEADTHGGLAGEVKARVDAAMQAQHGPLMDTDAIRAKALEAVHNDRSTELLALERQALQDLVKKADVRAEIAKRNRKEAQVEAQAAQREARNILDRKAVKDIRPSTYLTAERNAAVRVSKALAKGDYEAAATAKREQLVNHALAREAMRAQKEIQKTVEKLADRAKDGRDFQKMPYAYARQLDEMLARFGFKDAPEAEDLPTLIQIAQGMAQRGELADDIANSTGLRQDSRGEWGHETLSEFVTRQNESYFGLELPSVVMGDGKPYRELTLPELSDLEDTVQTLVTLGKNRDRFLEAFEMADINEAGKTFADSVRENFGEPEAKSFRLGAGNTSAGEKVLGTLASIPKVLARWMDTMLTTCHKFDGLKADGPAKKFIYRRMSEAENRRLQRTHEEMARLDAIFAKHFEEGELGKYKDSFVRVGDNNVSRLQLLSMALNWGNLGNRDRITRAEGMTEGQVEELLFKHLGKRDFDFAQDVWTYLDKFRPEIKKLEMDVNGVEPKFVEASPIITPWGTYEGGYYPIHYDPERSAAAYRNTEQTTALYKQFGAAKAQTEQGHTVARVNTLRRPIKYSLDVLTDHVEDVIHDLEFRKPVIDVARFLQQKDAKAALLNALGVRGYNSVNDWLKAVASGPSEPLHFGESAARWLRFRTTMFYMGYRLASVPKIAVENLNNISSELGVSEAARAMKDYYTGDSGLHEFVTSKSEFMRQRAEHLDRDMSDVYDKYSGEESLLSGVHKFAFWTHAILDQGVSFPLWTHVFKQAMAAEENEAKATHLADEAVKRTFMSGGAVDQAAIMRGSESQKALTVALGYQSMMWNRYSQQLFATGQALRQGRPMDALAIAARAHFYSFVMPAAIGILTHELVRNSQGPGNPEDEKKRILADALKEATPLKFIPVARDVFPYFVDKSLGMRGSDLQVTPLERAAQTLLEPAAEAFRSTFTGQPLTPRFGEKTAGAISLTAGVPKEFNDVVFNFLDWQRDHGAATWRDFVSRRVKH